MQDRLPMITTAKLGMADPVRNGRKPVFWRSMASMSLESAERGPLPAGDPHIPRKGHRPPSIVRIAVVPDCFSGHREFLLGPAQKRFDLPGAHAAFNAAPPLAQGWAAAAVILKDRCPGSGSRWWGGWFLDGRVFPGSSPVGRNLHCLLRGGTRVGIAPFDLRDPVLQPEHRLLQQYDLMAQFVNGFAGRCWCRRFFGMDRPGMGRPQPQERQGRHAQP